MLRCTQNDKFTNYRTELLFNKNAHEHTFSVYEYANQLVFLFYSLCLSVSKINLHWISLPTFSDFPLKTVWKDF